MFTRVGYFARETLVSLRRNLLMTLAGIITVAVSLGVLGSALLIARLVEHGTQRWKNGVELEIFLNVNATQAQTDTLQGALKEDPDVRSWKYLTKQDAYDEFKRLFRDQPDLVQTVDPQSLPTSFRVAPRQAELTETVAARYQSQPGVDDVKTANKEVKKLLAGTRTLRLIFLGVSLSLALASLFLIVNTIRLATFARRREIEVMKLVGASNWFVRIPFIFEGIVQGLIGAAFAVAAMYALKQVITNVIARDSTFSAGFYLTNGDAFTIGLYVLLAGCVVGAIGSVIGLRRFLEV